MTTEEYLRFLYGDRPGWAAAMYTPEGGGLRNLGMFHTPEDIDTMAATIEASSEQHDTYASVYQFDRPRRLALYALPSDLLHLEVDEPEQEWHGVEPTLTISSSPGRYHHYWRLDELVDREDRRRFLRALVSNGEGDPKAADLSRVLRPAGTWSHKRGAPVEAIGGSGEIYSVAAVVGDRNVPMPGRGRGRPKQDNTDLEKYLTANDIEYEPVSDELGIKFAVPCPWADAHTTDGEIAYVGKIEGGGLWFNCYHSHCNRRGWSDFKAHHFADFMSPKVLRIGGVEVGR